MNEIIFVVEEAPERRLYRARRGRVRLFTEADDMAQLHAKIRDAVRCHFEEGKAPKLIRLHFVRDELIAV